MGLEASTLFHVFYEALQMVYSFYLLGLASFVATWRYVTSHVTIHIGQTECWPETCLVYWLKPPNEAYGQLIGGDPPR